MTQSYDTQTWSEVHQNKVICKISPQYVRACRRKVRKTVYILYSKFKKRHNSFKNWRKVTTLKLDLKYINTKSYAKFQLKMSKRVGEKCGKLHISYFLSSQRVITPSKTDAKWRHSNLTWSTLKETHVQNFSSICQCVQEKSAENGQRPDGRTDGESDGDPDGHHHTIIRPVWRRAYKKDIKYTIKYIRQWS